MFFPLIKKSDSFAKISEQESSYAGTFLFLTKQIRIRGFRGKRVKIFVLQPQEVLTDTNYILRKEKPSKGYMFLVTILIGSYILYDIVGDFEGYLYHVFRPELYLTWHNLFEGVSILTSFCIFAITFYSYDQTKDLRSIVLGSVFLAVGLVDAFHTLSYKGMPVFFTASSAPKATTFWIIARLITALGILGAFLIPRKKQVSLGAYWFAFVSIFISCIAFFVVTYTPHFLPPMFIEGQGITKEKILLEYFIITIFIVTAFLLVREFHMYRDRVVLLLAGAMVISIYSELAFTMYRSVYDTYNLLGHIYKIVAFFIFFRALFVLSISEPYLKLAKADEQLKEYATHLEALVEERTKEILKAKEALEKDLLYARAIQMALLPRKIPRIPGVEVFAEYKPYSEIGGDFYNFIQLEKKKWGFLIGDVSGHGVSSAMITVFVNQTIKLRNRRGNYNYKAMEPTQVLSNFYHRYNQTDLPDEFYLGMYYAVYDAEKKIMTYSNGGLNCVPLRINQEGELESLLVERSFPICKLGSVITPYFEQRTVELDYGDKIVFYTDGIVETVSSSGEYFGEDRLREILKQNFHLSVEELGQKVKDSLASFRGLQELTDDVTFFIMEIIDKGE